MKQKNNITGTVDSKPAGNKREELLNMKTIRILTGGIAHDFNNILATISGYSELLLNDLPESSAASHKVSGIQMAVTKARSLTDQLMAFSSQIEQANVPVNVYDVLKETISFVKSASPSDITIRSIIHCKYAPVLADPTKLFRVFLNLMTNAVQSLEDRKGIISVSLSVVGGKKVQSKLKKDILADEYVLVNFRDTGKGIDSFFMKSIFDPFVTTQEGEKGHGMGLAVVYGIVTEMGGEILVSSEKGKGSVFHLYLPVYVESG